MSRLVALAVLLAAGQVSAADEWTPLFNGKDLSGWETFLGTPPGGAEPLGRNRDPKSVFSVVEVDGKPALRISGEGLGGIATLAEYENYHLELEFKWGEKRFAPRANEPRDSGLLYHASGDYHPTTGWLESVEFGILEGGETGDFWSVPGPKGARIIVDIEGEDVPTDKAAVSDAGGEVARRRKEVQRRRSARGARRRARDPQRRRQREAARPMEQARPDLRRPNGHSRRQRHRQPRAHEHSQDERRHNNPTSRLHAAASSFSRKGPRCFIGTSGCGRSRRFPAEFRQALKAPPANTLTEKERADGWRLLFDGTTTKGWRGYKQKDVPAGWRAIDGALVRVEKAGDLITEEQFGDFELAFDWKVSHGGNSGVFYRATEDRTHIYETAPEYEIRDSAFWTDNPYTNASNYALHPPTKDAARPVGYWNSGRSWFAETPSSTGSTARRW